jgi:hypothetical protein
MEDIGTAARTVEVIADRLSYHGFGVENPAWDNRSYLRVADAPGALCDLILDDDGDARWEYRFCAGSKAEPARIAAAVLDLLLADDAVCRDVPVVRRRGWTSKDSAARALADRGMQVGLRVYGTDDCSGEGYTEIEVANPALRNRGTVRVNDDGALLWDCQVRHLAPGCDGIELREIIDSIARALTRAVRQ